MGWKLSLVIVDGKIPGQLEPALARLVGEPIATTGQTTVEEALYPSQLAAGVWRNRTLILDEGFAWAILRGDRGPEQRLLETFPTERILVAFLQSTVNCYGFAYYEGGERLRLRLGDCDGIHADEGELLPAERAFYQDSEEREGGRIFFQTMGGETHEFSHDAIGEEFVFELTRELLGERLDACDDLHELEVAAFERKSLPQESFEYELSLEVEGEGKLVPPKLTDVVRALAWLDGDSPSFLILEHASRGYVQAGGSADGMTVEWREGGGESFRHFVAARREDGTGEVHVPMSQGGVTVRANEVLDKSTAETVFSAFYRGEARPAALVWRDVTERFG